MSAATPIASYIEGVDRLVQHAMRDSGQSRIVANFLLAWWNAKECGGFDLTDIWAVDEEIATDMQHTLEFIARYRVYPDKLGLSKSFEKMIRFWRPRLLKKAVRG